MSLTSIICRFILGSLDDGWRERISNHRLHK